MSRLTVNRTLLVDAGLALVLTLGSIVQGAGYLFDGPFARKLLLAYGSVGGWHHALTLWWVSTALLVAGMLLAHRWPLPALGLASIGAAGHQNDRLIPLPLIDFAVLIVLYSLASRARSRLVPLCALVVLVVGDFLLGTWLPKSPAAISISVKEVSAEQSYWHFLQLQGVGSTVEVLLMLALAVVLGDSARTRQAHLRTLQQRAADLEREQQQRAVLAAAAERARITRELHDVVAHGLSVIVIQAQGAAAALRRHPERTEAALRDVIATGRGCMAEMRGLLGVVRRDPAEDPQLAPQPGVAALPALVDQVRAAGAPVVLTIEGEPVPLPVGVDLSGYRIVQESLTNTLKHAGPSAKAQVRLAFRPDQLEIEVSDDGRGTAVADGGAVADGQTVSDGQAAADGAGSGLAGIAERVSVLGGTLVAGPSERGFRVRAVLPLAGATGRAASPLGGATGPAVAPLADPAAAPAADPVWSPA
ncbi:sensor histidine kinase [Rugosimonospora africana]|uniref:sensor histidine kinase n=1 Tax=Rugosimonospora africana TaxID=556532 RepID=UPI0019423EDD|nr:histidine kinase [Rugosimonospora africana]